MYTDGILLPTAQGRRYGSLPQPGLDFGRHHNFGWGPQASAVTTGQRTIACRLDSTCR
uniref:Uncharacterized protein n=1 Tax=Aegilops tauschii subsp. strangulata TaxID=200361 RepID=A0A453HWE5_AEGTS